MPQPQSTLPVARGQQKWYFLGKQLENAEKLAIKRQNSPKEPDIVIANSQEKFRSVVKKLEKLQTLEIFACITQAVFVICHFHWYLLVFFSPFLQLFCSYSQFSPADFVSAVYQFTPSPTASKSTQSRRKSSTS